MKRSEQKPYRLTAPQWRALSEVAKAYPRPIAIWARGTAKALLERGLIELRSDIIRAGLYTLSDLGQRVYSRLSVGIFCSNCERPVTFEVREAVPNASPAKWQCLGCARRLDDDAAYDRWTE